MTKVELYGREFSIRDFICSHRKFDEIEGTPSIRLYVRVYNTCNGKCKFCLNHKNTSTGKIDKEKLGEVIRYLKSKNILNAITLTGGEPMLDYKNLNDIVNFIYDIDPNMRISISTNGTNLKEFLNFDNIDKIEAIHISRHHWDDNINNEILGVKTASLEDIKYVQERMQNKNTIIINSVMMKKYIEKLDDVKKMANVIAEVGVKKIHFVSLIDYGDFCRENYVDTYKVFEDALKDDMFYKDMDRYRKDFCECHMYKYITDTAEEIKILARIVKSNNSDYIEQLVYTNDNKLITGFDSNDVLYS